LVLLVGHNPTLEDAVQMLTDSLEVTMSLCVLARLNQQLKKWSDFKQKKTNLGKNLIELLRP
jgi:phosphohistidine phosphatase SixA